MGKQGGKSTYCQLTILCISFSKEEEEQEEQKYKQHNTNQGWTQNLCIRHLMENFYKGMHTNVLYCCHENLLSYTKDGKVGSYHRCLLLQGVQMKMLLILTNLGEQGCVSVVIGIFHIIFNL